MKYVKYALTYTFMFLLLFTLGFSFYLFYASGMSAVLATIIGVYSVNLLFIFIIFIQKRQYGGKLSWIMTITILPIFGHILFVFFGQRFKGRQFIKEYNKRENFKFEKKSDSNLKSLPKNLEELFKKESISSNRAVYKGDFEFFDNGDESFRALFQDLRKAKKFIHIHYYIIKKGEIYEELKDILLTKVKEGIKIRIIIDDFGKWALPDYEIKILRNHGIVVAIFGKFYFPFIGSYNGYRTHRKMAIIDGMIVHTGGINIANEYANLSKKYGRWIDYQVKITGQAVRSYSLLFLEDWFQVTKKQLVHKDYLLETKKGQDFSLMIEDSPEVTFSKIKMSIVNLILNARKSIKITTPYFIPDPQIQNALIKACLSGVEVSIFIPGKADKISPLVASKYYADEIKRYGAKIFQAKDMMIHSKIALFDDEYAYFGTINLDYRTFYSQFEIMNLISGSSIQQVIKLFKHYELLSRELNADEFKSGLIIKRVLRFYVNLFSPIM